MTCLNRSRQLDSSTEDLGFVLGSVRAAFIRSPQAVEIHDSVKVLARRGTAPDDHGPTVAVGTGQAIDLSLYSKLTGDARFHRELLGVWARTHVASDVVRVG